METVRVDICYRPLRIGWAIQSGDAKAFRQAVKLSNAFWGGRFNPIVIVDREEANSLVDLFRLDLILPIGESSAVKEFPARFPHLFRPMAFFDDALFAEGGGGAKHAKLLDVHNALVHVRDSPDWTAARGKGFWLPSWEMDDPLADVFLSQFGAYPTVAETGVDYRGLFVQATDATEVPIGAALPIPGEAADRPSISYLARYGLERHYGVQGGWDSPGFFVGDAADVDDLVCHWNLRAADIPLWFIDPAHLGRYSAIIPAWADLMKKALSRRHTFFRDIAAWSRREDVEGVRKLFGDLPVSVCPVSVHSWNGLNVRPPTMSFDQVSTLGVIVQEEGRPKVSFQLPEKPFCGDVWFHNQHLVASVSFIGGLYRDDSHTLRPPFVPELNEFFSRSMQFRPDTIRVEPDRLGIVIDASDVDAHLFALAVPDLFERVFGMAGMSATPSTGGLIVRQLIARLGGLQGSRVFKIPGVRRLLRAHGPQASFTKKEALQLIGGRDPANPGASFDQHEGLYIERREAREKLRPESVFGYLVEKGLFRIGWDARCPSCRLTSWVALDALRQRLACDLCGNEYDVGRQLAGGVWRYRRSGVFGVEKNAQGAVPVALTLQQLDVNLGGISRDRAYSPSLTLASNGAGTTPSCEVDFVWLMAQPFPRKTAVILGECKSQGSLDADVIGNLKRVADALPKSRFETYVLLANSPSKN